MSTGEIVGAVLMIGAAFAYVNHRWIRLPSAIGLMAIAMALSIALIVVDRVGIWPLRAAVVPILDRIALGETLLHGALGVMLFAGALHIDLAELHAQRLSIAALAIGSTVLSMFAIASLVYFTLPLLGVSISFAHGLLFGAIIAPTDPIGVLGILREAKVPKSLEMQIAGESLFNDGVGVVAFVAVSSFAVQGETPTSTGILTMFLREVVGGAAFGLATGYVTYRLVKSIDHYQTELLLTLALVVGGYAAAEHLHISAPIAAVVSGLLMGNQGRSLGMSDVTRDHLDKFWSLVDEILNTLLFVLVGFELIRLSLNANTVLPGLLAIPLVLFARFSSVAIAVGALRRHAQFARGAITVLTWGGLRGGISIALALSLPTGALRELLVTMTYFVVVFSVLVQGLTLARVAKRVTHADSH